MVITHYLEMTSKSELIPTRHPSGISVAEAEIKNFRFNKFLYQLVGENWSWKDKLGLSNEDWKKYAESENLNTWVAYIKGSIAGYYELQSQLDGNVELAYFGLAPDFIGQGYGSFLLSHAIASAWTVSGAKRVWVHTCSQDRPNALSNYKSRGFRVYDETHS